jgi:hypothetical protein
MGGNGRQALVLNTPPKPAPYMHMQRIDNVVYGDSNNAPNTPGRPDQTTPDPTRPPPRMRDAHERYAAACALSTGTYPPAYPSFPYI